MHMFCGYFIAKSYRVIIYIVEFFTKRVFHYRH